MPAAEVIRPEQVTAAWLSDLLGVRVASVAATPVGTGQVASTLRFTLDHDDPRTPRTLVGKFASPDPASRAAAASQSTYVRETHFYRDLAAGRGLPIPQALHVAIDDATRDFALLMEDLAGHRTGDQLTPLTLAEAEVTVGALAHVHAAFWNDASLEPHAWLPGSAAAPRTELDAPYALLWPAFCDRYAGRLNKTVRAVGEAYLGRCAAWANRAGPRTLVHGDVRSDNLMFSPDGGVTIVDWQTIGVGCAATDLAYFTGTSLAPELRREAERALFERWLSGLPPGAGADALWRSYRRDAFAGFLMGVAASMMVQRTERGDAMFLAMCERSAAMVRDHGSASLI